VYDVEKIDAKALVANYRRRLNKGTDMDPEATRKMERASMHDVS